MALDRHLAGCDPCRRDLAAVAVASSALRDTARLEFPGGAGLPPPAPVMGSPGPALPDRRRRGRWLLGAAAVVLALVLGGAYA